MLYDIQYKINKDINLKKYLRENSYWYKYLNRNSSSFKYFVDEMKSEQKCKLNREEYLRIKKLQNNGLFFVGLIGDWSLSLWYPLLVLPLIVDWELIFVERP